MRSSVSAQYEAPTSCPESMTSHRNERSSGAGECLSDTRLQGPTDAARGIWLVRNDRYNPSDRFSSLAEQIVHASQSPSSAIVEEA